jgi:hypothetical protein
LNKLAICATLLGPVPFLYVMASNGRYLQEFRESPGAHAHVDDVQGLSMDLSRVGSTAVFSLKNKSHVDLPVAPPDIYLTVGMSIVNTTRNVYGRPAWREPTVTLHPGQAVRYVIPLWKAAVDYQPLRPGVKEFVLIYCPNAPGHKPYQQIAIRDEYMF